MPAEPTPSDIHPVLYYDNAAAAIEWLQKAFGFRCRFSVTDEDGRIEHSELSLGTGVVMVSSSRRTDRRLSPLSLPEGLSGALSVCVADPDSHHRTAVAAGARIVRQLQDEEYGARGYMAADLEGHLWYFGNYRPGEFWDAAPNR